MIKTRLGLHEGDAGKCSDAGLIILQLAADKESINGLASKLEAVEGVKAKLVEI